MHETILLKSSECQWQLRLSWKDFVSNTLIRKCPFEVTKSIALSDNQRKWNICFRNTMTDSTEAALLSSVNSVWQRESSGWRGWFVVLSCPKLKDMEMCDTIFLSSWFMTNTLIWRSSEGENNLEHARLCPKGKWMSFCRRGRIATRGA